MSSFPACLCCYLNEDYLNFQLVIADKEPSNSLKAPGRDDTSENAFRSGTGNAFDDVAEQVGSTEQSSVCSCVKFNLILSFFYAYT